MNRSRYRIEKSGRARGGQKIDGGAGAERLGALLLGEVNVDEVGTNRDVLRSSAGFRSSQVLSGHCHSFFLIQYSRAPSAHSSSLSRAT